VLAELETLPGADAAVASQVPLGDAWTTGLSIEGGDPSHLDLVATAAVSPGYFRMMGIPLRDGRDFRNADTTDASGVIVVSESLAKALWPGQNPLGRRAKWGRFRAERPWVTVVGVVSDVRTMGLDREATAMVYQAFFQIDGWTAPTFFLRSPQPSAQAIADTRTAMWRVERDLPVQDARSMREVMGQSLGRRQFIAVLMIALAATSLLLAVLGLFSVMHYNVSSRIREIGLRLALGGAPMAIYKMVLGQGVVLTSLGVVVGLIAAFPTVQLLQSMLYGVHPHDAATFGLVALIPLVAAVIASYVPARRAMKVDPVIALRGE
jgi:predicted permease